MRVLINVVTEIVAGRENIAHKEISGATVKEFIPKLDNIGLCTIDYILQPSNNSFYFALQALQIVKELQIYIHQFDPAKFDFLKEFVEHRMKYAENLTHFVEGKAHFKNDTDVIKMYNGRIENIKKMKSKVNVDKLFAQIKETNEEIEEIREHFPFIMLGYLYGDGAGTIIVDQDKIVRSIVPAIREVRDNKNQVRSQHEVDAKYVWMVENGLNVMLTLRELIYFVDFLRLAGFKKRFFMEDYADSRLKYCRTDDEVFQNHRNQQHINYLQSIF